MLMRSDFLYIKGVTKDFYCTIKKCLIVMNGFQACVNYQNLTQKCYHFFTWLIRGIWESNYFEYIIVYTIKQCVFTVLHRAGGREVVGEEVLKVRPNLI